MELSAACTAQNSAGSKLTTAILLAQNVQEATADLPFADPLFGRSGFGPEAGESLATYNDVDDFDGLTCNPPIDSFRRSVADLSQFTQVVSVIPVSANQLSGNTTGSIAKGTYTGALRVTAIVLYRTRLSEPAVESYRTSWIRLDR